MTMLSWRNHFACDVLTENGSAHIESLCKYGPSTFTHRRRVCPSARPPEHAVTPIPPAPAWEADDPHVHALPRTGRGPGPTSAHPRSPHACPHPVCTPMPPFTPHNTT